MPITSPFGARSTALEVVRGHDLSGQVALVTGATSGLGVETARALLSAGAHRDHQRRAQHDRCDSQGRQGACWPGCRR